MKMCRGHASFRLIDPSPLRCLKLTFTSSIAIFGLSRTSPGGGEPVLHFGIATTQTRRDDINFLAF